MRLLLTPLIFWANTVLLGGQGTEFHINAILSIASYTTGVSFPIQFAYRPKAAPFTGEACDSISPSLATGGANCH